MGKIDSQMRLLQDLESSSVSVRKNEVKSNLIAITGNNSGGKDKGQTQRNDVQECSWTATCDALRLWAPSHSKLNHQTSNNSFCPTYNVSSLIPQHRQTEAISQMCVPDIKGS